LLQLVWIFVAYLIGVGLQTGVTRLAQQLDSAAAIPAAERESARSPVPASSPLPATSQQDTAQRPAAPVLQKLRWVSLIGSFPLFIYTLFGGLLLAQLLVSAGRADLMDRASSSRITGITMDLLVVAAITTLNLEAVAAFLIPVSILFVGGAIWSAFCLFVLAPRILARSHWFELGLINYGMSTGVTATGFILLRLVDPQLRTEAAKHYALAAPLSAPFVGGGVITIGLPLLVLQRVPIGLSTTVISGIVALLIVLGMRLARGAK
jgi:glutamate:Na+ symporter, ESS family